MSSNGKVISRILALALVAIMLVSVSTSMAFASGNSETHNAVPDLTVQMGATGGKISGASVYADDKLVGKTDSKGNLTLKEPLTGIQNIKVTKKGIKDITLKADFSKKPVVASAVQDYPGKNVTIKVADKQSKEGVSDVEIYNGDFLLGKTGKNGEVSFENFPSGLYLVKYQKEGYKTSTTLLIVASDTRTTFTIVPK